MKKVNYCIKNLFFPFLKIMISFFFRFFFKLNFRFFFKILLYFIDFESLKEMIKIRNNFCL